MMLKQNLLPAYLVGTAIVVMMASPSRAADALLPTQVAAIARSTVVRIEPSVNSPGSGVIIGRYREGGKNVYVVLTAGHVVQYPDDEYSVVTPKPQGSSGIREKILISTENDIQKLPGVDLAIVKFSSDREYQVATLGDSDYTTEGAGVYIAGFPNPGAAIKKRVFQFTSSLVSSRLDGEAVEGEAEDQDLEGGYAISYTNITRAGMSGGPVFDVAGRVVGIHGKGDRDRPVISETSSETGPSNVLQAAVGNDKTGFNLGIPIRTFLRLTANTSQMGIKFDRSEPGGLPGGGLVALRGRRRPSGSQSNSANSTANNAPPTNISEEEDASNDIVVGQPRNNNRRSNSPVTPQNRPSRQPAPTPPQNQTPAPSSPPPSRPGRFF